MASKKTEVAPEGLTMYDGTVRDVARFCGVPESSIYRAVAGGRIPAVRIGKHWRFNMQNVREFFRDQEARSIGN